LGGFLALCAAATFAFNNALARRGVLTGSVLQAMSISVPLGLPIFLVAALFTGAFSYLPGFSTQTILLLSIAGIVHFVWGRYCNYRAVKAIGSNLAGPLTEGSVLVALALAVMLLGESLTPMKVLGIVLVLSGPAMAVERPGKTVKAGAAPAKPLKTAFQPKYAEGYTFALLSATGYGISPILVRFALERSDWQASIAGGLVSYVAATLVVVAIILASGNLRHVLDVPASASKWFGLAGLFVGLSQLLRYMALSMAPVSVVTPIQRLSLIFRLFFSLMNREHEVFSSRMVLGTVVSLFGAVLLSLSVDSIRHYVFVPDWLLPMFTWSWP
jgi:uncharacterized membrane protein